MKRAQGFRNGWWSEPPWWAWVVMVAGTLFVAVVTPIAMHRGQVSASAAEAAAPTPAAPTRATVVAFLGDSYTAGAGASNAATDRWPLLVADQFGWVEKNFGFGGTGYTTAGTQQGGDTYVQRVPAVAAAKPDVVIVSGGRNDLAASVQQQQDAVRGTFQALRKALPHVRIIALQPMWDASSPPSGLGTLGVTIEAEARAVGGSYVAIGDPLYGRPDLIGPDHVHPTTAGHRALADAVIAALRPLNVPGRQPA